MPPKPTHIQLQGALTEQLLLQGWEYLHVRKSVGYRKGKGAAFQTTTNIKGWPDVFAWKQGSLRHLAIEVKVPPDDLSLEQVSVFLSLDAAGMECYVFRPGDTEAMVDVLASKWPLPLHPLRWHPLPH